MFYTTENEENKNKIFYDNDGIEFIIKKNDTVLLGNLKCDFPLKMTNRLILNKTLEEIVYMVMNEEIERVLIRKDELNNDLYYEDVSEYEENKENDNEEISLSYYQIIINYIYSWFW